MVALLAAWSNAAAPLPANSDAFLVIVLLEFACRRDAINEMPGSSDKAGMLILCVQMKKRKRSKQSQEDFRSMFDRLSINF